MNIIFRIKQKEMWQKGLDFYNFITNNNDKSEFIIS